MKASIDTTAIRNRRLWIALVASIVLNASTLATHALGQPAPDNTPLRFHDHAAATAIDAFDRTGLWILASGAIATSVAFQFDQSMHD